MQRFAAFLLLLEAALLLATNAAPIYRNTEQNRRRAKRFVVPRHKWNKTTLNWRLHSDNLDEADEFVIRNTLHRAFNLWEEASNVLEFLEAKRRKTESDLNIHFLLGDHGDGMPFDGPEGMIGHAFYPPIGELHLDAEENWALNGQEGTDLYQTLVHEIGHLLGLEHSSDTRAVMYPLTKVHQPMFELADDDVRAIRFLYPNLV